MIALIIVYRMVHRLATPFLPTKVHGFERTPEVKFTAGSRHPHGHTMQCTTRRAHKKGA